MTVNLEAQARKVRVVTGILERRGASGRVLVVGCGDGREAGQISQELGLDVVGIDLGNEYDFAYKEAAPATLLRMDAQALQFEDQTFDVIYSFHALEHMSDPYKALSEMGRLLRRGGTYLVGTPNKQRALGYIGSASPVIDRIQWNLADWRARLAGRWSNAQGAHAGFTSKELLSMCADAFGDATDVSDEYYMDLYAGRARLIQGLIRTGASRWAFPAVYVAGRVD
jgi:ubiquinone/menaquinone biosynthesis C-methylase UbiE